jgi:Xaa-Pro aminopeptidase
MLAETDEKTARLAALARAEGAAAVVLASQANFAWLTGGGSNRIDASREAGSGALCVTADGRRFVIASAIEMPRLVADELQGLGFEPVEYAWTDERADPGLVVSLAAASAGAGPILSDLPLSGASTADAAIAGARVPLTAHEIARYRALGTAVGVELGALCSALEPGLTEQQVARGVNGAMGDIGARAIVTLVAADDRVARFRHPIPTETTWHHLLLLVVCAERGGLVVALSRIVTVGRVPADLDARTRAAARVFGRLVAATREGATGAGLFETARDGYAAEGFAGEERLHHQGGAIGYRSREWVAHPASGARVTLPQAFAWNPSVTGTKVEETVLVTDRAEAITLSPEWPAIALDEFVPGLAAPGILRL